MNFDEMTMEEVWKVIDSKLNSEAEPIEGLNVSYSFELGADESGMYGLKLADGKAQTITGDPVEVDCSLKMSEKDFKKLLAGNLNSTTSYMMGKLKVKGPIGLALKLENLLKHYSF